MADLSERLGIAAQRGLLAHPSAERLLSREDLAAVLGVSPAHVSDLTREGMPALDLGTARRSVYRYDLPEVRAWLRERRASNDSAASSASTSAPCEAARVGGGAPSVESVTPSVSTRASRATKRTASRASDSAPALSPREAMGLRPKRR